MYRYVLQQTPHRMVYINCMEHKKQGQILRVMVSQLKVCNVSHTDVLHHTQQKQTHKRKKTDKKTDNSADMGATHIDVLQHLAELLPSNASAYIVLDAPEHLEDPSLVSMLHRIPELLDVRMGIILISQLPWGSQHFRGKAAALPMPAVVHMPQYDAEQATAVRGMCIPHAPHRQ